MRPRLEKQNQVNYSNRSRFDRDLIILQRAIKKVPDWSEDEDWRLPLIMKQYENSNVYLLLAEFSVRTVNYGPSVFFFRFMAQARSVQAINRWKKTRIHNLQCGPKKRGYRCVLHGFFEFGGPVTSAGRAIWQSFDRRQERNFLFAHENSRSQQRVSEKGKTNSPCWKSLFGQN